MATCGVCERTIVGGKPIRLWETKANVCGDCAFAWLKSPEKADVRGVLENDGDNVDTVIELSFYAFTLRRKREVAAELKKARGGVFRRTCRAIWRFIVDLFTDPEDEQASRGQP